MSVLSGEYNVTAGVLTRDIYQRLFNANASGQKMLWVGRLMTLALGGVVTIGALFVGGFGGAFEANKLFTGLFAIPMTLPLILGVVLKRPRPGGALATVVVGMIIGLVLNAMPTVSWEMATFIEIVVCVGVFLASGLVKSPDGAYRQRVEQFFQRLATPLTEAEKPTEDRAFMRSMNRLYAVALAVTGGLFMVMSGPSLGQTSGRFAFGAGVICLLFAGLLWYWTRPVAPPEPPVPKAPEEAMATH